MIHSMVYLHKFWAFNFQFFNLLKGITFEVKLINFFLKKHTLSLVVLTDNQKKIYIYIYQVQCRLHYNFNDETIHNTLQLYFQLISILIIIIFFKIMVWTSFQIDFRIPVIFCSCQTSPIVINRNIKPML